MATINLGNLTFTHKGDYAGGTAYVKNDVVYYATNGNSYIAKTSTTGNAPTSTSHWDLFVAGASGIWNAGLSLGSAGQVVKVNSGGSALEFANDDGGTIKSVNHKIYGTSEVVSSSGNGNNTKFTNLAITVTPQSASSKFLLMANINGECNDSPWDYVFNFVRTVGGSDTDLTQANGVSNQTSQSGFKGMCAVPTSYAATNSNNDSTPEGAQPIFVDVPNTTSAITYSPSYISNGNNFSFNRCVATGNEGFCSTFVIMEF